MIGFDGMEGVKSVVLDAGKKNGLKENMPFISENGLAGKICRISDNKSIGQALCDKNFRAAARLQESRYTGLFEGTGKGEGVMWGVSKKAKITIGEAILTSGMNSLFPSGLKIGTVKDIKDDPSGLYQLLIIEPFVDYSRLEEVLIIQDKETDE